MRILISIIWLLVEVAIEVYTAKRQDDARAKSSTGRVSRAAEDPPEFTECEMCGKPSPAGTASCISCGFQAEPTST
jgi:hypothetical protein